MSCSALARRAFARLDIDPAKGREMALHGARAWNDLPANFSFDPEGGEGAGFLVGAYACAGTGGSDLLITLSLPEEALALEGKGKGRKALAEIRITVRDEAYRLLASKEGVREPRAPSREERDRYLLTDSLITPPGPCRISVRVADGRTGNASVLTIPFDVPDFSGETVRLGGPILASKIRRLTGEDGVILRRGNRIEPRPGGVFRTDEEAMVYFEIENLGIGRDRRSHYRLFYRLKAKGGGDFVCELGGDEGGKIRAGEEKSSRVMSRETAAERCVSLDLSTLPPGRYTLHIRVEDETGGAEDRIAASFEVVRP